MPPSNSIGDFPARRYVLVVATLAGGFMALVAALNFWVDPNGYFSCNTLGYYVVMEHPFKLHGLQRHTHDAVLLGDSKAAMAGTSQLRQPFVFFNGGVGGAMIEDILAIIHEIPATCPLIVVELDYLEFNNTCEMGTRFPPFDTSADPLANVLNLQVTLSSLKTLAGVIGHQEHDYLEDGSYVPTKWFAHYDHGTDEEHTQMLNDYETMLRGYRIVPARVALLAKLRALLEARNKPYLVYIHPTNAEEMVRLHRVGLFPAFEAWREHVHLVFPQVTDLTTSRYSDPKNYYRQDVVHPYPEIGGQIIQNEVLPKLGKKD